MTRPTPETIAHRIHATPATVAAQVARRRTQRRPRPTRSAGRPAAPRQGRPARSPSSSRSRRSASTSCSASPAARSCRRTTRCSTRRSGTSWSATSRARGTRPPATRRPPARSASASRPPARARPTWSPRSPTPTWTRSPIVAITGQVPRPSIGTRRLPGGRHPGHHAADHQAQLPGADRRGDPADPGRGVPPGRHRPARPGPRRHPQGRAAGADHVQLAADPRPARLPADAAPARQADPRGGPADQQRQAPGAVRRRRRAQGRRHRGAAQARRADRHPGGHHADGPRRVPRLAPAAPRHARHARHGRRGVRAAEGRPARRARRPLRRPGDRQARLVRARTRRSCTPTSTRPRSARTAPPTCRSSATPST